MENHQHLSHANCLVSDAPAMYMGCTQPELPKALGPFVPMGTAWTAAKAAIATKFSERFAVVMMASANENVAVKIVVSPRRLGVLCTRYSHDDRDH